MTRRARMLRLDQRTGRLERAIHLMEDGMNPGLMTREPDKPHPQSRKAVPGFDRAQLTRPKREFERGDFVFRVGQWGNTNLTRNDYPALSLGLGNGYFSVATEQGYGYTVDMRGYGAFGYGGFDDDTADVRFNG